MTLFDSKIIREEHKWIVNESFVARRWPVGQGMFLTNKGWYYWNMTNWTKLYNKSNSFWWLSLKEVLTGRHEISDWSEDLLEKFELAQTDDGEYPLGEYVFYMRNQVPCLLHKNSAPQISNLNMLELTFETAYDLIKEELSHMRESLDQVLIQSLETDKQLIIRIDEFDWEKL